MNLRQRKKARTRDALADAAVRLFLARGFEGTTIDDVVAAAGVSRRTFFRYFPSKEAAFFSDQDERAQRFGELVDARTPERGVWRAVCDSLLDVAASFEEDREAALAWRRVMRSSTALLAYDLQMDTLWERRMTDAFVAAGWPAFEASARAGAVMGVVRAVLVSWYEGDGRGDLAALGRLALGWLEAGVPPERLSAGRRSP